MIPDSPTNRRVMRAVIRLFRAWGHLCLSYTLINAWRCYAAGPRWYTHITAWRAYCAAEAGFLLFFVAYARYLQRPAVHPPSRSKAERRALFDKVYVEVHDPVAFLRGWFKGAEVKDIGIEGLQEFLIWSFWDGRAEEVEEEELQYYVDRVRQMAPELSFREGSGNARGLRLTMDNFEIDYRTLFWYAIIMFLDNLCFGLFMSRGYTYHRTAINGLSIFPPRPGALISPHESVCERTSYWVTRPHTSKTRRPILYFHGIGIGLITYALWVRRLDESLNAGRPADDQVGILLIETPQISSRLTLHAIARRDQLLADYTAILDAQPGYDRFVLSGHSYGSIMSTYVLRDPALSARVAATLLVDPVAILLHMPDVAYNFTVRPPVRANELQLWFFAAKDPGIAHTLGRNFFWYENVLWRDVIMDLVKNKQMKMTVSLGSDDLIVDAQAVGAYLMENEVPDPALVERAAGEEVMELQTTTSHDSQKGGAVVTQLEPWKTKKWSGEGLEVMWWPGFDHATVYSQEHSSEKLIEVLVEYSRNAR